MTKEQWTAIKTCDETYDGVFFYGIRNSKRVCRPSCRKRSYDPKRVILFETLEDAAAKGYQPCTRCHPELAKWEGPKKELALAAEKLIREHYREKFSLDGLADMLHINKSYLLRTFKEITGSTLLEYHNRVRCEAAQELLTHPEYPVCFVASEVGFVSHSNFSKVFRKYVGKSPKQYRADYLRSLET